MDGRTETQSEGDGEEEGVNSSSSNRGRPQLKLRVFKEGRKRSSGGTAGFHWRTELRFNFPKLSRFLMEERRRNRAQHESEGGGSSLAAPPSFAHVSFHKAKVWENVGRSSFRRLLLYEAEQK